MLHSGDGKFCAVCRQQNPVRMNRGKDNSRFEMDTLIEIVIRQERKKNPKKCEETIVQLNEVFTGQRTVSVYRSTERGDEEIVIAIQSQSGDDNFWLRTYKTIDGVKNYISKMKLVPDVRSKYFLENHGSLPGQPKKFEMPMEWKKHVRVDGRIEYNCTCGVGHSFDVHGCCGKECCKRIDFPLNR